MHVTTSSKSRTTGDTNVAVERNKTTAVFNKRRSSTSTGPVGLGSVSTISRPHVSVVSRRLGHMLNNNVIPKDVALLNNRPNVKGDALALRAVLGVGREEILCIDNRRDTRRVGLETSELTGKRTVLGGNSAKSTTSMSKVPPRGTFSRVAVLYRARLRGVFSRVRRITPRLVIVSSVRAVTARDISDSPNSMSRIHRYTTSLLEFTGADNVPIVLVKRVGGRKALTNPGVLRRVISAIVRFRNSRRCVCHVLQDVGGQFKDASRLNVCRVLRKKLERIDGPSRLLLARSRSKLSNITVDTTVRNIHPFLIRARTLMDATTCKAPRHSTANFSRQELGVLLTIVRGQINFGLVTGSIFLGVTKNLQIASPTVSLDILTTMLDDGISATVRRN